jgi:hypothetical protein
MCQMIDFFHVKDTLISCARNVLINILVLLALKYIWSFVVVACLFVY